MSVSKMAGLSQSLHTPPRSPAGPFVANPRVVSSSASLSRGVTRLASHFGTVTRRNALPRFPLLSSPAVPDSNTYIRLGSSSGRTTIATSTVNGIRIVKFVPIQASLADPSPHSPSSSHSSPHSSPPLSSSSSPASSSAASPRFSAPAAKSIGRGRQAVAAAPDGGTTETVVGPRFEFVSSPPYDRQRRAREPSVEEMREVLLGGEVGQALDGNAARAGPSPVAELSYELVQGALVRWSEDRSRRQPPPPTAVLIHGILGSGKNWGSFARRLATEFPAWQFLCVDLRCHGASLVATATRIHSQHLSHTFLSVLPPPCNHPPSPLPFTPSVPVLALSMIDQAAKPMPSAIKVWVLDATPGKVRAGGDGEDHPADLIDALRGMPPLILDRSEVVNSLLSQGFSKPIAQWMTTNLSKRHLPSLDLVQDLPPSQQQLHEEAARAASRGQAAYGAVRWGVVRCHAVWCGVWSQGQASYGWAFDLEGISQMYSSYETTNLWSALPALAIPPSPTPRTYVPASLSFLPSSRECRWPFVSPPLPDVSALLPSFLSLRPCIQAPQPLPPYRSRPSRLDTCCRQLWAVPWPAVAALLPHRAEGAPSLAASSHVEATPNLKHGDGSLLDDSLSLARNDIFTINVLGYAAYTFVIGAYAYWAPKAMREIFHEERADALFGGITVVTGMGGTLFGGLMLDRMGATIPNALLLQSRVTVVGAIFCLLAFASPSILLFVLFMAVGEFFIFAIQGPANIVSLQCVPSNLRALAIAAATVVAHLLGDVPSPPILGLLQDMVGNWRISMGIFTAVLLPAAALWAHGATLVVPPSHHNKNIEPILHSNSSPSSYTHLSSTTTPTTSGVGTSSIGNGTGIDSPIIQGSKRTASPGNSVESTPLFGE
ncbi:unnamed protein product [Closterium sp. NIES-54]